MELSCPISCELLIIFVAFDVSADDATLQMCETGIWNLRIPAAVSINPEVPVFTVPKSRDFGNEKQSFFIVHSS